MAAAHLQARGLQNVGLHNGGALGRRGEVYCSYVGAFHLNLVCLHAPIICAFRPECAVRCREQAPCLPADRHHGYGHQLSLRQRLRCLLRQVGAGAERSCAQNELFPRAESSQTHAKSVSRASLLVIYPLIYPMFQISMT